MCMCCGAQRGVHGMAMTDYQKSLLSEEETKFWDGFTDQVKKEMGFSDEEGGAEQWIYGGKEKIKPSEELQAMHDLAIAKYNGPMWCHFNQVLFVFDFAPAATDKIPV